jgi:hypothetical protein
LIGHDPVGAVADLNFIMKVPIDPLENCNALLNDAWRKKLQGAQKVAA